MDLPAPVASGIKSPDPMQSLNMMGAMTNLQQSRQQLQRGALALTGEQQTIKEKMALAKALQDPVGNGFMNPDGSESDNFDKKGFALAPTTWPEVSSHIRTAARTKVEFNTAVNSLTGAERGPIATAAAGAALTGSIDDVKSAIDNTVSQYDGTSVAPHYQKIGGTMKNVVQTIYDQNKALPPKVPGQEAWRSAILNIATQVGGPDAITQLATPSNANVDKGGSIQPGVVAPALSGGGFTSSGAPITKTIAPGQQQTLETDPQTHTAVWVVRDQRGNVISTRPAVDGPPGGGRVGGGKAPPQAPPSPSVVAPQPGAAAPAQAAPAAQTPSQPASTGFAGPGAGDLIEGITKRVGQAIHQANNTQQAQDALTRALTVLDSKDAPNTGGLFGHVQSIKNYLSSAGVDTKGAEDMNTLTKNLARYEASRATAAGLGSTDAARELSHNGSPNVKLDNAALRDIVRQSLGTEKALSAYATVQSRTTDPQQMLKNESDFRSIPNVIVGYEYGLSKNAHEADAFLEKHHISSSDMKKIRAQIKEFEGR